MTPLHNRRTILIGGAGVAAACTGVGALVWHARRDSTPGRQIGAVRVVPGADTKQGGPTPAPIADADVPVETPDPELETRLHRLLEDDVANSRRRSLERRQGMAVPPTQTLSDVPTASSDSTPPAWAP